MAALTLLAALACQNTYYEQYRSTHPDWDVPDAPIEGMELEQVIAFVYAPDGVEDIAVEVTSLEIHEGAENPWRRIELDALRRGAEASREGTNYAVIAEKTCTTKGGLEQRGHRRVAYYLLPGNRLEAWDHYTFRADCGVSNRFQAARGRAIPMEAAVVEHLVASYGKTTLSLEQLYRRGLAYVAAGRLLEARATLEVAEPAYRAAIGRAARDPKSRPALVEVARLRASLMRALGLEEKPADA